MAVKTIYGVKAGGMQPYYVLQKSDAPGLSVGKQLTTLPATQVSQAVMVYCHGATGAFEIEADEQTAELDRGCLPAIIEETIGVSYSGTFTGIWDQQKAMTEEVNHAYKAFPEGAEVFVLVASGKNAAEDLKAGDVVDIYEMKVGLVTHPIATSKDEDLTFVASLKGQNFSKNVKLS